MWKYEATFRICAILDMGDSWNSPLKWFIPYAIYLKVLSFSPLCFLISHIVFILSCVMCNAIFFLLLYIHLLLLSRWLFYSTLFLFLLVRYTFFLLPLTSLSFIFFFWEYISLFSYSNSFVLSSILFKYFLSS